MATDILCDDYGDLAVSGGDFKVGLSDENHVEDILVANKGDYKASPAVGVGLIDYLHGPLSRGDRDKLTREIQIQLNEDGMKDSRVSVDQEGGVTIKGHYST